MIDFMNDLVRIHTKAIEDFDRIINVVRDEREQCLEDRRFYSIAGAQWEGSLSEQYAEKPKFEINKVHLSVLRIINEYRNNRITVDYIAKDGAETHLSDTCDGLYRSDEQYCNASEAYDNAFEEAVGGGYGAWRYCTEYEDPEDPENEKQRIKIEPIFEADSNVFFDLDAKRQDKADARYCYVLHALEPKTYDDLYPNDDPLSQQIMNETTFEWNKRDVKYIAEYYCKKPVNEKSYFYQYVDGTEIVITDADIENDPDKIDTIKAMGGSFDREKVIKTNKVYKYTIGGNGVLEDHGVIAGRHLPIVPVYGKRWFIDNVERCMGHVRMQKDAQRLKNMNVSKLAEISAMSPIEKPIFSPEQMGEGYEARWADDNIKNYPWLPLDPIRDAEGNIVQTGPIGYTKPPQIPPATIGLMQGLDQDMQELMGRPEQGEELGGNLSGKAIELVQNRLDMQSYVYMDNMRKAMQRGGQIWLSMAREIYVEGGRKMKAVDRQEKTETITLLEPAMDDDGKEYEKHDLSKANLEVYSSVGASSVSKKQATIRTLMALMQVTPDPQDQKVLSSMIMMNMEGEGINDVKDYYRKQLVNMGAVKPNKQEQLEMQEAEANKEPTPQDRLVMAAASKEEALAIKAQADAENAEMDTLKKAAEIDNTVADTAKTYSDIGQNEQSSVLGEVRSGSTAQPQI